MFSSEVLPLVYDALKVAVENAVRKVREGEEANDGRRIHALPSDAFGGIQRYQEKSWPRQIGGQTRLTST